VAGDDRLGRWARVWISPISLGVVLVLTVVVSYVVGTLIHNLNASRAVGVFAVGVIAFLGTLSMAHRDSSGPYDSGEVRIAVTCAFMMVYFAILGIFLFSINEVGTFGQGLVNNLTSLFGVVVGFYFASSAVVEYGRSRAGSQAAPEPPTSAQTVSAPIPTVADEVTRVPPAGGAEAVARTSQAWHSDRS
jgi:hypothetical protein